MSAAHDRQVDAAAAWLLRLRERPDDAGLRQDLERWIAQDDAHARAWGAVQDMWCLSGVLGPAALASPHAVRRRRLVPRWRLAALGLALAAGLAIFALPGLVLDWRADYRTGAGETRILTLADGSRVRMDSDSAVAVAMTGPARQVALLSGQAFFEVAPNAARPFVVRAGAVDVTVTGTAFDVRRDRDRVTVEVERGSVRVDYPSPGRGRDEAGLSPGDRLAVSLDGGVAALATIPEERIAPWRRNRLLSDGASVGELVREIGRYRSGLVVVADNALAGRRVTGVFDLSDPLRALRAAVEPYAGRVREITPWLVLVTGS